MEVDGNNLQVVNPATLMTTTPGEAAGSVGATTDPRRDGLVAMNLMKTKGQGSGKKDKGTSSQVQGISPRQATKTCQRLAAAPSTTLPSLMLMDFMESFGPCAETLAIPSSRPPPGQSPPRPVATSLSTEAEAEGEEVELTSPTSISRRTSSSAAQLALPKVSTNPRWSR